MNTRLWVLVAAVAALIVAHASAPSVFEAGSTVANAYYLAAAICLAVAIFGLADRRTSPVWPWAAILATLGLWVVGDLAHGTVGHGTPSIADLFYLSGYVILIAGLWEIARRQSRSGRLNQLLDLGVPYLGLSYAVWQLVIAPTWAGSEQGLLERLLVSSYPMADVVVAVLVLQIVFTTRRRTLTTFGLGIAAISLILADAGYAIVAATDSYGDHAQSIDSLWLVTYLGLAVAVAWSADHRTSTGSPPTKLGVPQALAGAVAIMVVPTVVAVNQVLDQPSNPFGLFIVMAGMLAISGWRFVRLSTAASEAHRELARREHYYRVLAFNSSDVVVLLDDDDTVIDTSQTLNGATSSAFEDEFRSDPYQIIHRDDRLAVTALVAEARRHPGQSLVGEAKVDGQGPDHRWMELRLIYLPDDPVIAGLVVTAREITERKLVEAELEQQVLHDGLTGLANRALFRNRLDHTLARIPRHGGSVTVVFIDLDGFKEVNEDLGQRAGDALLCEVALRLADGVRADDTVARLGGDEFALLLDSIGEHEPATEQVVDRVRRSLSQPFDVNGTLVSLTNSIGVARDEGAIEDSDTLLHNADLALFHAKSGGGDRWVSYEPSMGEEAANRRQLENDLRHAVSRGELVVHYQPLVDLSTGALRGFEALVRWNHPRRGLLPPGAFIGIAESTGAIVEIGDWVLRTACDAAATWSRDHPERQGIEMSVNLSARQLADPRLTRRVMNAIESSGMDPHQLVLELTESVLVEQPDEANAHLRTLGSMGVRLAVDDFGTGYSSLAYLQQFSVDIIKIDRGFVQVIEPETGIPPLIRGMLDLSRSLEAECIAEGIEERHQADVLIQAGCLIGQGFLYSRPVDHETASALLAGLQPLGAMLPGATHQLPLQMPS